MSYNLLKRKKIIFRHLLKILLLGSNERIHEGGTFVLTNAVALRMGQINALAEKTGS
jgi:hypothetical protein